MNKIEKGIPFPIRQHYPELRLLEPGETTLLTTIKPILNLQIYVSQLGRKLNRKFMTHKEDNTHLRVWRIK